jgi:hypothetical protein
MFTPEQYRANAAKCTELARQANTSDAAREFRTHERSLTMLADNKQWLADNDDKLADHSDEIVDVPAPSDASEATLAAVEEHKRARIDRPTIWTPTSTLALSRGWYGLAGSIAVA